MTLVRTLVLLFATLLCGEAGAWPDRPLRLVVPFTAGTGIDTIARVLAARLPEKLGQPVSVENMPGASGNIGSEAVARARPDGHTLLVTVSTFAMNTGLFKTLPFDPVNDFAPITLTSWGSLLLVAHPDQKPRTLEEFLGAARAAPGKLAYASPGVGTPHHLSMALLSVATATELLHVPYKGTAGALTDLLGGRVGYMFLPIHVALPQLKSNRIVALAAGSPQRLRPLPSLPTLAESGLAGIDVDMWYGVMAPKGTPSDIVERLNREIVAVLQGQETREQFESQGMVPATSTPEAFGKLVEKDVKRWAEVVAKAGIRPE